MSNLLEQASLVLIPSGYKEDVVYSEIPLDGSGDMNLTRASNGTRINSAGLVEVCPWNLLQQSENFDNAIWTKTASAGGTIPAVTANDTTAPNGTLTADKIVFVSPSGEISQLSQTIAKSDTNNGSFYIKAVGLGDVGKIIAYRFGTSSYILVTLTADWVRIDNTQTGSFGDFDIVLRSAVGTSSGTVSIYIWGAQLNIGSTAKPYFPTTDRLNVPRLTYQNGGGGCPSLLLEKQSTNYARNNNDLTGWTKITGTDTISLNAGTSPDGTANGINLIPSTGNGTHMFYDGSTSVSSSGNFTMSCYAKANGYSKFSMRESASVGYYASFDLSNGTVLDNGGNTASIENLGNGWYRCICSVVASTTVQIGLLVLSDSYTSGQPFGLTWSGDGTKGILTYGAQLEVSASYVTSLISTAGVASATRVVDACSKTGISSLIGQTEGVVFWDIEVEILSATGNENILNIDDGTGFGNTIYLFKASNDILFAVVYVSGVGQCSLSYTLPSVGRYKMALAYKANDFAFYVNGVSRGTDSSGSVPTCSRLQLGNGALGPSDGKTNQAVIFPTRLTNSELASLTTI